MQIVVEDVSIVVVGGREAVDGSHAVGGGGIRRREAKRAAGLIDVAEGIAGGGAVEGHVVDL